MIISADAGSVTRTGAWMSRYSSDTRTATAVSSHPITTRCGARVSRTACPSRRNSGLDATPTSVTVPADLSARGNRVGRADRHRRLVHHDGSGPQHRRDVTGDTFDDGEVGRAVLGLRGLHADEDELRVARRLLRADDEPQPPARSPSSTSAGRPSSRIGTSPFASARIRDSSTSAHNTWCPRCAKHAAVGIPTCPAPITAISLTAPTRLPHVRGETLGAHDSRSRPLLHVLGQGVAPGSQSGSPASRSARLSSALKAGRARAVGDGGDRLHVVGVEAAAAQRGW